MAATERNRLKALADIDSLEADGGTEIAPALRLALSGDTESSRLQQVVFLTDGAVGNERALFTMIRERVGDARLFTVGIGSAPNTFFMTRAAALGRGDYTFIGNVDEVADTMAQLFAKLEHPVVTDLSLSGEDSEKMEVHPLPIADLYAGKPLTVVLRSSQPFGKMDLAGRLNGAPWHMTIDGSGGKSRPGIATLWARKKIRSLMDTLHLGAAEPEVRRQVVDVALRHQLVSRYTSLVAVEEKIARPDNEMLKRQQMKTNLPKGWQHAKVFGTSARTATNAGLNMLVGILLMISALWILRPWSRRAT